MRLAVRSIISLLLGLLLLVPLGAFYGLAGLPVYHSWGLMHGSFTTAIPALVAASFVMLGLLPWFGPTTDPAQRVIAALSVFPLVTVLFWVDQSSLHVTFSYAHGVVYAITFCLFAGLCVKSKKPLLIPLFLLIPMLVDPTFGLLLIGISDPIALQMFVHDLSSNVLPITVVCGAALVSARFVHRHKV